MRPLALAIVPIFLGALTVAPTGIARAQAGTSPLTSDTSPRFTLSMAQELATDGRTSARFTIQVPYPEIQFVRVPAGYGAAVEFLLVVRDGKGREVGGDAWEQRFVVAAIAETQSPGSLLSATRTLKLGAGKYRVRAHVRDANSRRQAEVEGEWEVRGMGPEGLALSTPVFGECAPDTTGGSPRFLENASRRFVSSLERFCVRVGIFDTSRDTESYEIAYRVLEEGGEAVREDQVTVPRSEAGGVLLTPEVRGLFLGPYRLELKVRAGRREAEAEAEFRLETLGAPRGSDWDVLVAALAIFAGETAAAPLAATAGEEERERLWRDFWRRRDPDPMTPSNEVLLEFVRRVRYANANFRGLSTGFETDQGRIYLRYGPPDDVEDRPASDRSPPTVIWDYQSQRKRFVFIDRQGFGRYELLATEDL